MNCAEFRKRYHGLLDTKQADALSDEMEEHLRSCSRCPAYARAMKRIDTALREAPAIEFPADLERRLQAIPSLCDKEDLLPTWGKEIRRAAVYVIPVALMAILGIKFAPDFQLVIRAALATLGLVTIVLQRMRRPSSAHRVVL